MLSLIQAGESQAVFGFQAGPNVSGHTHNLFQLQSGFRYDCFLTLKTGVSLDAGRPMRRVSSVLVMPSSASTSSRYSPGEMGKWECIVYTVVKAFYLSELFRKDEHPTK
jgi:hypothetical protein